MTNIIDYHNQIGVYISEHAAKEPLISRILISYSGFDEAELVVFLSGDNYQKSLEQATHVLDGVRHRFRTFYFDATFPTDESYRADFYNGYTRVYSHPDRMTSKRSAEKERKKHRKFSKEQTKKTVKETQVL